MIEFSGVVTEKDYKNYIKTHMMYSKITRKWMFATMLIWPIMEVVNLISEGVPLDIAFFITVFIMFVISVVFVVILYYVLYRVRVKQTIKDLRQGDAFDEKKYVINGDIISITSRLNTATFKWSGIKKIRDKYDTYYLYVNSTESIIVPKRYLSDEDISQFKACAGEIEIIG